jgi:hypothetical protein
VRAADGSILHTPTQTAVFTPALPMRDGEAAQAVTRTRRLCLRRPRPSAFVCLSSLSQTLAGACIRALEMSSSHGNGMAARRASRGCTAVVTVVAACRACGAADEACAVKMVLEASEVAHSVAYSSAET